MEILSLLDAADYSFARFLFERGLAVLYLVGFLVARNQGPALIGEKGLLPAPIFLSRIGFQYAPSFFHWRFSDRLFEVFNWIGILLSLLMLFGVFSAGPIWLYLLAWTLLWTMYLSIVNIGQRFYSFGWESMLIEAGFLASFLGPEWVTPSFIPILALRWMVFRVEVGAGLIKLRGDTCWRDLTCLYYHHETQPMPNPLSWYFHKIPKPILKSGALFSHFVQIVTPFGLFLPQPFPAIASLLIIFHQLLLIIAGNYSWLNWLTVVLAFSGLPHTPFADILNWNPVPLFMRPLWYEVVLLIFALAVLKMSIRPALNLCSSNQYMNYCWNRFHLIGAYGAFGSVTKKRYEIVLEGTWDEEVSPNTKWLEYEFKGKPGDLAKRPKQYAPYHLRLDWLMWFLPFSVDVTPSGLAIGGYEVWFFRFIQKLLDGDKQILKLIQSNPFVEKSPQFIRARYYLYQFTSYEERKKTGHWWKRTLVGEYLPPLSKETMESLL